jgi:type III restriction enzyme
MTPSSFNSKDNILNRPLEREMNAPELFVNNQEPPKSYLECLKRLNPIVIMDEPHRFEGNAFKTYFEGFDNFYLRFGAPAPARFLSRGSYSRPKKSPCGVISKMVNV